MTDVQCREERGRKYSLYNTPPPHPSPLYNLLHRLYRSDRSSSWCMLLACFWFCFASFTSLYICYSNPSSSSARDHLILYILTISQQTRPTHSQRPPIKLAQGSTLLFGSFPSSPWASCPSQSMGGGQATMLAFQTQIYFRSKWCWDSIIIGTVLCLQNRRMTCQIAKNYSTHSLLGQNHNTLHWYHDFSSVLSALTIVGHFYGKL